MAPIGPLRSLTGQALPLPDISPGAAYRLRWKRRRLLWRSFRSRHGLTPLAVRTDALRPHDILVFATMRNEMLRLPWFLSHYRNAGATQFLIVDNDSTDGTADLLAAQPDVSVWRTEASYRGSRFGLDWLTWLLMRHGHGYWCVTVDADELLVYPGFGQKTLRDLTDVLDARGQVALGAVMLDLYPDGPLGAQDYDPARDPATVLTGFDAGPWRRCRQSPLGNLWLQGGARDRVFFADDPGRSPTLNKLPLVRWNRRYAYVNSTHAMLPRRLNALYHGPGDTRPCGVLLHTKFLPDAPDRAREELRRRQHFNSPENFAAYHAGLQAGGSLWHDGTIRYEGPAQLADLGLMPRMGDVFA